MWYSVQQRSLIPIFAWGACCKYLQRKMWIMLGNPDKLRHYSRFCNIFKQTDSDISDEATDVLLMTDL